MMASFAIIMLIYLSGCSKNIGQENPLPNQEILSVDAGSNQQIFLPAQTAIVEASISFNDRQAVNLNWQQISGPDGIVIEDRTRATLVLRNLREGVYLFRLTAEAGTKRASDEVTITVTRVPANEPENGNGNVGILRQLTRSATDFQQFEYDAAGRVSQYVSQWQFMQNSPQVRRLTQRLEYNQAGKLMRIRKEGSEIRYVYDAAGTLLRAEEYNTLGDLLNRHSYQWAGNKLVEEIAENRLSGGDWARLKSSFEYDQAGNLTKETKVVLLANGTERPELTIEYSEFDRYLKHPADDFIMRQPFVGQGIFQVNNPGKKVIRIANGRIVTEERYSYTYGNMGYPSQKATNGTTEGVSWTASLNYQYE